MTTMDTLERSRSAGLPPDLSTVYVTASMKGRDEHGSAAEPATLVLLDRWHGGDQGALARLVEQEIDWIRKCVRKRANTAILARIDAEDVVHDAVLEILRYSPRFEIRDREHLRALLARMVLNTLCRWYDYFTAVRRDMHRETGIPSDSVLSLSPTADSVARPSQIVAQDEDEDWVRLALEFLEPEHRHLLLLREWDQRTFPEIGSEYGITADAARMRHKRAVGALETLVVHLRSGDVPDLIKDPQR